MKTFIINKIQGLSGFSRKLDILSLLSYNKGYCLMEIRIIQKNIFLKKIINF